MTDLRDFLLKNKKQIHELLNHMWDTIEKLAFKLEKELPESDLDNTHGNFITFESGWAEAHYPNPSITFPFGEIGYSLDGLYCVFALLVENLEEKHLVQFLAIPHNNQEISLELYGGDDCFSTIYNSIDGGDIDDILKAIKASTEEIIQIELEVEPFPETEVKEKLFEQMLYLYNFLQENDLLIRFPTLEVFSVEEEDTE
jgi:hypothetical protein